MIWPVESGFLNDLVLVESGFLNELAVSTVVQSCAHTHILVLVRAETFGQIFRFIKGEWAVELVPRACAQSTAWKRRSTARANVTLDSLTAEHQV